MKKYYIYDDLKRKTHYDLYKICVDEKLVEGFNENLHRTELINIILKYRSKEKIYSIEGYKEYGLERLQEIFDTCLGYKLNESSSIKIPHKMVMYKTMPLTWEDNYKVSFPEFISNANVFLVNGQNYLCGIFQLEICVEEQNTYYLVGGDDFFRISDLKNQNYSLRFFNRKDEKSLSEQYYTDDTKDTPSPYKLNFYEVPLDSFQYADLEVTDTVLCIDFGTSNTTAGTYLDSYYINEIPQHKILSGDIILDKINYVKFYNGQGTLKNVIPTMIYIEKYISKDEIKFLFGHEVETRLKENGHNLKGSLFYGIKNWVKSINQKERIVDENGNIAYIERKTIIKAYIEFIIGRSEFLFKCKFKNVHISTPVKLKHEFLSMFQSVLPDYEVITERCLDEGVAVLYNSLENIIKRGNYENKKSYKALIIDCGGGTTDLASCIFTITAEKIYYNVDIKTTFENSEESFGGNNITYRIMQYLKIVLAGYYSGKENIKIDDLIINVSELIFRDIDEHGIESIYEKIEKDYELAEKIIPTQFCNYENQSRDIYSKVKHNFFFLWEISEQLKKELFSKNTIVRTKFDSIPYTKSDISSTCIKDWSMNIVEKGHYKSITTYPSLIFNKNEIIKLIKGDIYEVLRRFLEPYYESGMLFDYSLIKLSGQTCKVNIFNEILKEFVPGKMIDFRRNLEESDYQLKINCVEGAICFLNSSKIGNIRVKVENDIPIVPYSLYGLKYNGDEVEILKVGEKAGSGVGTIKKISTTEILPLHLKNKEGETKKHFTYLNKKENYTEKDEKEIEKFFEDRFSQSQLDDILNDEVKFFIYTDKNYWGIYVVPVKRENNQLFIGKDEYYSFEKDITEISFFDGKH